MVKTYLRYVPSGINGIIASPNSTVAVDPTGKLLFTAELENVGVWNLRKGVEAGTLSVTNSSSGDYSAKPEVTCLAASPAGKYIAAGYADGMIRVFDYTKMSMAIVLNGHRKAVTSLRFNATGMLLASGAKDTDAIVWDLVAESGLCRLKGHKDEVTDVAMISTTTEGGRPLNLLITCSKDTLIKVWDLSTLACIQTVVGARVELWGLTYLEPHQRLLAVGGDNLLRVWQVDVAAYAHIRDTAATGSVATDSTDVLHALGAVVRQTHERGSHVVASADSSIIAVQSAGKTVEVYRQRTGREVEKRIMRRLKRHREKLKQKEKARDAVTAAADADGEEEESLALAGMSLGDIDAEIARLEKGLDLHTESKESVEKQHLSTARDELELIAIVQAHAKITSVAFFDNGVDGCIKAAVVLNNNQIEIHTVPLSEDAATVLGGQQIKTPAGLVVAQSAMQRSISHQGHRSDVRAVCLSSDNALVLTTSQAQAKVWSAKTGTCIRTLDLGDDSLGLCCAFGPANRHAIIGTKEGKIKLFDLASGDQVEECDAHEGPVWSIAVRPDGRGMCSGSADKQAKFWDFELRAAAGTAAKQLSLTHARTLKLGDEILCVKYSHHKDPSRILIAMSLLDATVKVFFDDTLKFFLSLYGHKLPVMAMDISADDTLLVTASADKNVKLWGLDFGDCHKSFFAHSDSITCVSFVANTHYFFCGSKDRTIKYYDGDRFEHILTLEGHKGEVWGLTAASDGSFITSVSHDRSLRFWRRSDEQVFLDEEREREMDALVEKDVRDADGDAVLHATDAIGPLQADGTAKMIDMDSSASAVPLGGAGAPDASGIVAHANRDTMKGSDRLTEALVLAMEETEKWQEYAEDIAAAAAAGEDVAKMAAPTRNPLLLNLTPARFILKTLRAIRPTDVDQVLLVLPFGDAMRLLRYLNHLLRCGEGTELCVKAALLILRVHLQQIIANQTLLPLMASLNESMLKAIELHKDHIGFNMAALRYLLHVIEEMGTGPALPENIVGESGKEIRVGKRRKAVIF